MSIEDVTRRGLRVKNRERVEPHDSGEPGICIRSTWYDSPHYMNRYAKVRPGSEVDVNTYIWMGNTRRSRTFTDRRVNSLKARLLTLRWDWRRPLETKMLEWIPDK